MFLLDVAPIGIYGPIVLLALLIAIPVVLIAYFAIRSLRRQVALRREREQRQVDDGDPGR